MQFYLANEEHDYEDAGRIYKIMKGVFLDEKELFNVVFTDLRGDCFL